jgi:NAD(P)H dehydrogenase (quinone)
MIVVTAATGQLGRLVLEELLQRVPASDVTAVVRTPEKAADLAQRGVRIRVADYNKPATLDAAFDGADRVLLISSNDPQRSVEQHTAAVGAAKRAGVGLLAYTSLTRADVSTVPTAMPHKLTEPVIRDSGVPFSLLRNATYTDHFAPQLRAAAASGVLVGSAAGGRVASATRADLAAAAAAVLTGNGHENTVYELTGDTAWNYAELAEALSQTVGREIEYHSVSAEEHVEMLVANGTPRFLAELFAAVYRGIADGQFAETTKDLRTLIGRPTTPLADAVAGFLA